MCGWSLGAPTLTKELAAKFPKRQNRETNRQNREYFFKSREALSSQAREVACAARAAEPAHENLSHGRSTPVLLRDSLAENPSTSIHSHSFLPKQCSTLSLFQEISCGSRGAARLPSPDTRKRLETVKRRW